MMSEYAFRPLALSSGFISPTIPTAPKLGELWSDTGGAPVLKICSNISPVTFIGMTVSNADTVTTNANLTGHITSSGNAAVLGSFTIAQLSAAISDTNISGTNTGDQDITGLCVKSNNLSDLTNATTARTNLALGSLSTQSGTFSGTSSGTNTGDQTNVSGSAGTVTTTAVVTGAISSSSATLGIGYATGAGGAVTQLTSKATATPAINKMCGLITMNGAALATNTTVAHTLTNSSITANDLVVIMHDSVGTLGAYKFACTPAAGSAVVSVRNVSTGSLSEAIKYRFAIIKGVVS